MPSRRQLLSWSAVLAVAVGAYFHWRQEIFDTPLLVAEVAVLSLLALLLEPRNDRSPNVFSLPIILNLMVAGLSLSWAVQDRNIGLATINDIGSSVDSCSGPTIDYATQIKCAMRDLQPGRLAFEPKKEMDQGREERVFIRISPDEVTDLAKGFKEGPPIIQPIRVGPTMRARLVYSQDEFAVRTEGEDTLILDKTREWSWQVTPLEAGNKTLNVRVYADLMLPNGKSEPYEAFVGSALIHVHVRPLYVVGKFLVNNWQWALGSPIVLGLFAWFWTRMKPRKRTAGF